MNMNQIMNMIMRTIMRKAINKGINVGVGQASKLGRGAKKAPPEVDDYGNVRKPRG